MRLSSAARGSLLLALTAVGVTAQTASRRRISVKAFKTSYKIDTWDDGRDELYRVTYRKYGLKSVYTFDATGHVKTLTARDTMYAFDNMDMPARMLLDSSDDAIEEVDFDVSSLIDCTTCGVTWNTLCDVGLADVCLLDDNNPVEFDEDAGDSVRRFCSAMGAACQTSADVVCGGAECVADPVPAPTSGPVEPPTTGPTPSATVEPTVAVTSDPTPAPTPGPTVASTAAPTPAPVVEIDACNPNPCVNGGSCVIDPAGGHMCSCASDFGGMSCQTNTTSLAPFSIEFDYVGNWTDARRAVFQATADRWSEVITHVPCGGTPSNPAGQLLITATMAVIESLGSAKPSGVWTDCRGISLLGEINFDTSFFDFLVAEDYAETFVLRQLGNLIGVGTLWGPGFAECSACLTDEELPDPSWACPAALSAFADLGGSGVDIIETKVPVLNCFNLDDEIFGDELLTSFFDVPSFLSKMTASLLEDIGYTVDPSVVDAYVLPSEREAALEAGPGPSMPITETSVETIVFSVDSDGNVDDAIVGVMIEF